MEFELYSYVRTVSVRSHADFEIWINIEIQGRFAGSTARATFAGGEDREK